jgi:hypothetical protein
MPGRLHVTQPRRARFRSGLLLALLAAPAWLAASPRAGQGADTQPQTVQMIVDYGDGVELRFTAIPWRKGLTALGALDAAAAHPRGVKYKARGTAANTLVTQIGDLKNEGGGTKSRNWIFKLDGKQSEVGVGAAELDAGQTVLWKFEVADYNR